MIDAEEPQNPHRVDEFTRGRLAALKEATDEYADLLCDNSTPRPGSDFAKEEGILSIRSPRDVATVVSLNALDHLRLLADHALATSRITAFASFTLIRSAITAAGLAGYLLAAESSKERLRRTLVITYHELSNARTAARELDGEFKPKSPGNESYNQRLAAAKRVIVRYSEQIAKVENDAIDHKIISDRSEDSLKLIQRKPNDTTMVFEAAKLISPDLPYYHDFGATKEAVRVWRTMSAHAHGLSWAAELSANISVNKDGAIVTTWNPQCEDLLQGIQVAWDIMYGVCARYIELLGAQPQ
ncbi:hypothetical protein [Nocardia abscessus]|uniref:hypothetical protein n=1 Tax=Nocardia abscessus TaxID=120957 RepID=UPI002455203B|nr:hypothetical protein [Nocardia abscessus]